MSKDDGGQAFPRAGCDEAHFELGMSLRDWFAGQALAGIVAEHDYSKNWDWAASRAYAYADAMIEERNKK